MRKFAVRSALLAAVVVFAACGSGTDDPSGSGAEPKDGPTITVGSADFSESIILAEIYAQALEAEGYPVDKNLQLGSREVYFPALEKGDLDLLPEYTGSALRFATTPETDTTDEQKTYDELKTALAEKKIAVLAKSDAQDKDAVVVTKAFADEHSLTKVSDLKAIEDQVVFGGPPECEARQACLKGLKEVYGIDFKDVKTLDVAGPTTVAALEGGEVQAALMFTTQGVIAEKGFVVLEDDKNISGSENIVVVVRNEIVEAYGQEFQDFVDGLTAKITEADLAEMNKRADVDKDDPSTIAKDWLAEHNA